MTKKKTNNKKSVSTNKKVTATKTKTGKISRKTDTKVKTKKRRNKGDIFKVFLTICFTIGIILFILLFLFLAMIVKEAPEFDEKALYSSDSTVLYDKDGEVIAKIGIEKRKNVDYDKLPEVLINAIIATEDSRFFQHNGVDFPRFFKASVYQVLGKNIGGASTLTMQLSKQNYTSTESSGFEGIKRKFTDLYMSLFKIEKEYTKEQILEFYVNSNFLGARSYGVEQACQTYFGKSVTDINLAEASIIAGLFQSPSGYNPLVYPEKTEERRKTVLTLMVRHGYITEEEKNIALQIPVTELVTGKQENQEEYQDFIDTVMAEVEKVTGNDPYNVPMEIYTTMDRNLQNGINDVMNGTDKDGKLVFRWENAFVDAGISVIETSTGALRAIGAGRNHVATGFNTAIDTNKQIGSTAKPLYDYAPGIELENWSTYTPWIDQPHTYSDGKTSVVNSDGTFMGFVTSRDALIRSRNIPALKAFQSLNNKNTVAFVKNLGLHPETDGYSMHEAHAIGGYNGESPVSLSAAYAAFGNKGVYNEPYSFTKIVYIESGETYRRKVNSVEAMSEETAYMIYSMLNDTAKYVMGSVYYTNGTTYGAKTGTTNYTSEIIKKYGLPYNAINDLWLVGVNTDYSVAVWYGYQRGIQEYTENKAITLFGNMQHRALFSTVIRKTFKNTTPPKEPTGVKWIEVETGCLGACKPSEDTPANKRRKELFKIGTEPTEISNRYEKLKNVKEVEGSYSSGIVTLSWDEVATPNAISEDYLNTYARKYLKKKEDIDYFVATRLKETFAEFGNVGYDIYTKSVDENGEEKLTLVASTTETTIDIEIYTTAEPITYVVKTAYEKFKANSSTGKEITMTFDGVSITSIKLNGNSEITLNVGDTYEDKGVIVLDNMMDVTDQATIQTTIKDSNDNKVDKIDTSSPNTYKITYVVKYNSHYKSLTRTINITEKEE